jgi:hypothetical protein
MVPTWERIKDALYLLDERSGATIEAGRGAIIGVMSTLEAFNFKFNDVWPTIIGMLPDRVRVEAIPTCWLNLDDKWTIPFKELVKFHELLEALPPEMLDVKTENFGYGERSCRENLMDRYLYVMSVLQRETDRAYAGWNSDLNGDPALKPQISYSFHPFRKAGSQYIAEWAVSDRRKEYRETINWHGQNTSQWLYAGCLLVQDGRVSIHT